MPGGLVRPARRRYAFHSGPSSAGSLSIRDAVIGWCFLRYTDTYIPAAGSSHDVSSHQGWAAPSRAAAAAGGSSAGACAGGTPRGDSPPHPAIPGRTAARAVTAANARARRPADELDTDISCYVTCCVTGDVRSRVSGYPAIDPLPVRDQRPRARPRGQTVSTILPVVRPRSPSSWALATSSSGNTLSISACSRPASTSAAISFI